MMLAFPCPKCKEPFLVELPREAPEPVAVIRKSAKSVPAPSANGTTAAANPWLFAAGGGLAVALLGGLGLYLAGVGYDGELVLSSSSSASSP